MIKRKQNLIVRVTTAIFEARSLSSERGAAVTQENVPHERQPYAATSENSPAPDDQRLKQEAQRYYQQQQQDQQRKELQREQSDQDRLHQEMLQQQRHTEQAHQDMLRQQHSRNKEVRRCWGNNGYRKSSNSDDVINLGSQQRHNGRR